MTQQIKRGWRMMLGIWCLLLGVIGVSGCDQPTAGVMVMPGESLPVEKELKSPGKTENSAAVEASKQVEPVRPLAGW
jgi:hypothetical protein